MRGWRHFAAAALVVVALAAPRPARANEAEAVALVVMLVGYALFVLPQHSERPVGLDFQLTLDRSNIAPVPLSVGGSSWRPGFEGRLALGLPTTGWEVVGTGGYLFAGSGGALRVNGGVSVNYRLGPRVVAYIMNTAGLFATLGTQDGWGVNRSFEWRLMVGARVKTGRTPRTFGIEAGLSLLRGGPHPTTLLGVRLSMGFGLPRGPPPED